MLWLVIGLLSFLLLLGLLLSVPVEAAVRLEARAGLRFYFVFSWLFNLVRKEIAPGGRAGPGPPPRRERPKAKKPRRGRFGLGTFFHLIRARGLVPALIALVRGLLGCFKIRRISVDYDIGLADPAATGLLFAVIGSVTPFVSAPRRRISLRPSFEDRVFIQGSSSARVSLRPITLAAPVARFIFSRPAWRAARVLVKEWRAKSD
ncbi:MAG: DUF2953 domain-containing protein [Chloroflexi bacterium]|nr:DUF2953 domain-containing protein [Chloroflexota bacterium]